MFCVVSHNTMKQKTCEYFGESGEKGGFHSKQ